MSTRSCSRREFLKIVGGATAAVGLGGGAAGLVSGCGGESATTTTAAPATTTTAVLATTTTAAPASSTTVSAGSETGREVKIGVISPQTGALAVFGIADKWSSDLAEKTMGDGMVLGDGKKHKITMVFRDTQSDSNRAAQVAGDLISNDKVDIIAASGSPDTVIPAADTAEAMATPLLSVFCPWSAFVFARGGAMDKPFKWTYGHLLGLEQVCADMGDIFGKTPDQQEGRLRRHEQRRRHGLDRRRRPAHRPICKPAGYALVVPSLYTPGAEDFTAQISEFKKQGCEILTGAMHDPGLHQLLETEPTAGLQAAGCEHGPGPGLPPSGRGGRAERIRAHRPGRRRGTPPSRSRTRSPG